MVLMNSLIGARANRSLDKIKAYKLLALLVPALGFSGLYVIRDQSPNFRLFVATIGMIWLVKVAALIWQILDGVKIKSHLGLALYLFLWPGVSYEGFSIRQRSSLPVGKYFFEACSSICLGFFLVLLAGILGQGVSTVWNYLTLFGILLIGHLGIVEVLAGTFRTLGFPVSSLFHQPYLSNSLRDFWSVRWNRAFVDMNKMFIYEPLKGRVPRRILTLAIFLLFGFLHEIGMSFSAGGGWGYPMLYFAIQGLGVELERAHKIPQAFVLIWIIVPAPLLFPPEFTNLFLGDLGQFVHNLVSSS